MSDPTRVEMIGIPGTGKSTFLSTVVDLAAPHFDSAISID